MLTVPFLAKIGMQDNQGAENDDESNDQVKDFENVKIHLETHFLKINFFLFAQKAQSQPRSR